MLAKRREHTARRMLEGSEHICLKQPCTYCMVRQNKPLPADVLTGPPPRLRLDAPFDRILLLGHSTTALLRELVDQLLDPSGSPATRGDASLAAALAALPGSARESVAELVSQLAAGEPRAFRIVKNAREDFELVSHAIINAKGVVEEWEPGATRYLLKPDFDRIGAHLTDFLPLDFAASSLRKHQVILRTGREQCGPRHHMIAADGRLHWYESTVTPRGGLLDLHVHRVPSVLDHLMKVS